jgi:hypothetical protein
LRAHPQALTKMLKKDFEQSSFHLNLQGKTHGRESDLAIGMDIKRCSWYFCTCH